MADFRWQRLLVIPIAAPKPNMVATWLEALTRDGCCCVVSGLWHVGHVCEGLKYATYLSFFRFRHNNRDTKVDR